jgi:hypothetical protein
MMIEKKYQLPGLWFKLVILINKNFRLRFEWDWKAPGIGILVYHPIFPLGKYQMRISIRVLWLLLILKFWERKQICVGLEIGKEAEKEVKTPELYVKQLAKFKDNNEAYLVWNWECLGLMIYLNQPKDDTQKGVFILNILWLVVVFDLTWQRTDLFYKILTISATI